MRLLIALVLVACSSRDPQPVGPQVSTAAPAAKTPYQRLEALMPEVLRALDELGHALAATGGDCTQLAKALRVFADHHAAMLPELGELMAKLSDQERQRFELEHSDDRERLAKLFAMKFDCPGNTEVEAALVTAGFRKRQNP